MMNIVCPLASQRSLRAGHIHLRHYPHGQVDLGVHSGFFSIRLQPIESDRSGDDAGEGDDDIELKSLMEARLFRNGM